MPTMHTFKGAVKGRRLCDLQIHYSSINSPLEWGSNSRDQGLWPRSFFCSSNSRTRPSAKDLCLALLRSFSCPHSPLLSSVNCDPNASSKILQHFPKSSKLIAFFQFQRISIAGLQQGGKAFRCGRRDPWWPDGAAQRPTGAVKVRAKLQQSRGYRKAAEQYVKDWNI